MKTGLKLLGLTIFSAIAGAWLGSTVIMEWTRQDAMPWRAPVFFTFPGALILGLVYGRLRVTKPRSYRLYFVIVATGAIVGGLMLAIFGSLWLMAVGGGYGFVTAVCWVVAHRVVRDWSQGDSSPVKGINRA